MIRKLAAIRHLHIPLLPLLLALLAAATFPACRRDAAPDARLLHAEALMDEHPDSALMILEQINVSDLSTDRAKALYGLLYTQGKDKNHRELPPDSLISFSTEYFKRKGDRRRHMVSEYYQGRTHYLAGDYPQAVVCFLNSKDIAEKDRAWFWSGMSCRALSDIYRSTYQHSDALRSCEQSLAHFRKTDRTSYINYALYDYGISLYDIGDYKTACLVADSIKKMATVSGDTMLEYGSLKLKGISLLGLKKYEEAAKVLDKAVSSSNSDSYDTLQYVRALIELNEQARSRRLLQEVSDQDMALKTFVWRRLLQKEGDYAKALELIIKYCCPLKIFEEIKN